jgi:uncharacterized MAPEG superfamily protein
MTIAELCMLAAVLIPLATVAVVKGSNAGEFDNAYPRDPNFYKSGSRQRAYGAHLNGLEAFPFFAAAVLLAEFRLAPQHIIDMLAVGYIVLRLIYVMFYLANQPMLRTIAWNLAFAANIGIFVLPAFEPAGG